MPQDTPIPLGLCQCGCGQTTKIATANDPRHGEAIGRPLRFVHGHNGRKLPPNRYQDHGDTVLLLIGMRDGTEVVVVVDAADAPKIQGMRWRAQWTRCGWSIVRADGPHIEIHRYILDVPPGTLIDHESRDRLDNRRANLRPASHSLNGANCAVRSHNVSGYKGVSFRPSSGRYVARIRCLGVLRYLGGFPNPVEAACAYDNAAREAFGEFARLNFPREGERSAR